MSFRSLKYAISVFILYLALITEVRSRYYRGLLIDIHRILSTVFTPMPLVHLATPNILHHLSSQRKTCLHQYFSVTAEESYFANYPKNYGNPQNILTCFKAESSKAIARHFLKVDAPKEQFCVSFVVIELKLLGWLFRLGKTLIFQKLS